MQSVTMKIDGMTCMGCVASVTRVLQAVNGVKHVDVSLERASAQIDFDPALVDQAALRTAVDCAGFHATP